MKGLIGILGGMGPAATVDIFNKFVSFSTTATKDQDHIPLLISSIPDIPDRSQALSNGGPSPIQHLKNYLNMLETAGAECIIIPCNTAHYWFDELRAVTKVDMISIIDSAIAEAVNAGYKKVGLLATNATLSTQLYQKKLDTWNIECIKPNEQQQSNVMESIYALKAGKAEQAKKKLAEQAEYLFDSGAEAIICGCTEVPIILAEKIKEYPERYIDSTAALVRAAIKWYQNRT